MASAFQTSVLLRGGQTGGELSAIVNAVPAGWAGPPLHRHDFDETFYVLDGELTFQLGGEIRTAGPGALAFARGGVPHTLANLGTASARYLLLCTPAGFERYFDRLAAEAAGAEPPPEAEGPIPPTTVLGPPLAERDDATPDGSLEPGRGRVNVLVHGERTGGRISILDNHVPAGAAGPPLHRHDFDELFYVVEGELAFRLGGELLTRGPGEIAFAPRGVEHAFANPGDTPARTLIACTPAGFERWFARIAAREAGCEVPAWALQPTPEVVHVGPPIEV